MKRIILFLFVFSLLTDVLSDNTYVKIADCKDEFRDKPYADIVKKYSKMYNIEEKIIHAVINQESRYKNDARSNKGAIGLMQATKETAKYFKESVSDEDLLDPDFNIYVGTAHLSYLMKKYKLDLKLALAAYNAGQCNVKKYNGIPPFKETEEYVRKVFVACN